MRRNRLLTILYVLPFLSGGKLSAQESRIEHILIDLDNGTTPGYRVQGTPVTARGAIVRSEEPGIWNLELPENPVRLQAQLRFGWYEESLVDVYAELVKLHILLSGDSRPEMLTRKLITETLPLEFKQRVAYAFKGEQQ